MSEAINPEAAQPSGRQGYEQSDRDPAVTDWGGTNSNGGLVNAPASWESRITPPAPTVSPDAGLRNYDIGDTADSVEDEAEREG
jgi:hypothetical protein